VEEIATAEKRLALLPAPQPSGGDAEAHSLAVKSKPTLLNLGRPMCLEWKREGSCSKGVGPFGVVCQYGHPHLPVGSSEVTAKAVAALDDEALKLEAARLGLAIDTEESAMVKAVLQARAKERARFLAHADRARELDLTAIRRERKPTIMALAREVGLSDTGTCERLVEHIDAHLRKKYGATRKARTAEKVAKLKAKGRTRIAYERGCWETAKAAEKAEMFEVDR